MIFHTYQGHNLAVDKYIYTHTHTVSGKKNLQFSLNNFDEFKRIFTIYGTHYPEYPFY